MEMSKRERRELKRKLRRERRESERREKGKKKNIGRIKMLMIPLIIIIFAVSYLYFYSIPVEGAPSIEMSSTSYDFGMVSRNAGIVSTDFTIKNTGEGDLIINNMASSCMCTTASLIVNGVEGPKFGMARHGSNPVGWSANIEPGEEAILRIYYDPSVHPDLTGRVTRTVDVYSNDYKNSPLRARIDLNQV